MRYAVVTSLLVVSPLACAPKTPSDPTETSETGEPSDDADDEDPHADTSSTEDGGDDDDDAHGSEGRTEAGETTSSTDPGGTTSTSSSAGTTDATTTSTTNTDSDTADTEAEVVAITPTEEGDEIVFAGPHHRLVIESAGARVMEYSLDGANVLHVTGERVQQGSTFWVAPQSAWQASGSWGGWPPPDTLENLPYPHVIEGDHVVFTSPPVPEMGIGVTKDFAMNSAGEVSIRYTVTATAAVTWAPWEVSRHAPGLCFYAPGGGTNTWVYSEYGTPVTPTPEDGTVWLPPFTPPAAGSPNGELLTDAAGWAGCAFEAPRLLLVKRFPDVGAAEFSAGNGDLKIWWQNEGATFLELEPMGAATTLQPGETMTYEVSWSLLPVPAETPIEAGSAALLALVPTTP